MILRAALVSTAFIGVLWIALAAVFQQGVGDVAAGAIVTSLAFIGIELMHWVDNR